MDRNRSTVAGQQVRSQDTTERTDSKCDRPTLVTEQEVASRYHVTIHSVRRWRREGRITFLKIGRQVLFRPRDLEEFEASHEVVLKTRLPVGRGPRIRGCGTIPQRGTGNG